MLSTYSSQTPTYTHLFCSLKPITPLRVRVYFPTRRSSDLFLKLTGQADFKEDLTSHDASSAMLAAATPDVEIHEPASLPQGGVDRKSTRLNSSHRCISYAVFCLKKKKKHNKINKKTMLLQS